MGLWNWGLQTTDRKSEFQCCIGIGNPLYNGMPSGSLLLKTRPRRALFSRCACLPFYLLRASSNALVNRIFWLQMFVLSDFGIRVGNL